jgi:Tfp pilus assembly protein PilX
MNRRSSIINHRYQGGSVLLLVVFLTALLAAVVMGHLQVNAEEIQLMQNQIDGAEALATAEAGLNDALAQLRQDSGWSSGFVGKPFQGGSYTVVVDGSTLSATGITARGFVATVAAEITIAAGGPPFLIQIDDLRINE